MVYRIGAVSVSDYRCELDSHADTVVAGANTLRVSDEGRQVIVHGYSEELESVTAPVTTVATLWDHPETGQPYILVMHEALYFGDRVGTTLICPNQLRANGLRVEDVPRQFDPSSSHSIYDPASNITIPLYIEGVASGFASRKPTLDEYEMYDHIELTSPTAWEPSSGELAEKEEKVVSSVNVARAQAVSASGHTRNINRMVCSVNAIESTTRSHVNDDGDDLADRLIAAVNVSSQDYDGSGLSGRQDETLFPMDKKTREIFAIRSSERVSVLTPEVLARRWAIGLDAAKRTLKVTTQMGVRNVLAPGERKLRQRLNHLKFPNLKGRFYTDTMFSKVKSLGGHTAAQVFTNGRGYDRFYPISKKSEAPEALISFVQDVGIPQELVSDNAEEQIHGRFEKLCKEYRIKRQLTVPYSPWSNLAEAAIRELKAGIRRAMRRAGAPKRTWNYCGEWISAIRRLTALDMPQLEGRVAEEDVLGSTPDISNYAQFDWYEPVWYMDPTAQFPGEKKLLGRWLGVAQVSIDIMAFFILQGTGKVVMRKSVWGLTSDESNDPTVKLRLADLDAKIREKIGDAIKDDAVNPDVLLDLPQPPDYIFEEEDVVDPADPSSVKEELDDVLNDYTPEAYDQYLTARLMLSRGGEPVKAVVVGRTRDSEGLPLGKQHPNPLLDTRLYDVELADGSTESLTANLIAETLWSQVDEEGNQYSILKEIVDHRTNGRALSKDDGFTTDKKGKQHPKITTQGWELEVEWRDGETSWIPLKDLKESNPVQLAEYAIANKISEEPAFAWWVRPTLRRRDRIIKKVKSRYWDKTHKFGIELPKSVAEALKIDELTGTDFWRKAIEAEMRNVEPAFSFDPKDEIPAFHTKIDCHMIFDIKMDLTRKARLVAGGHMTDPPKESTYSSVVSRDSIRIAFTLAALNDLDILSADVQGAYLNADTKEKIYTIAGLEFGSRAGRPAVIVKALYGLKSSGARWRDHMALTLREFGFVSSLGDPDVWMKPKKKTNGEAYWEYVLVYVDDILCVSHEPQAFMDYIATKYTLKSGSVKEPDAYLGAEIRKYYIAESDDPSKVRWAMSSDLYVKRAIQEVERELTQINQKLATRVTTPLSAGYRAEMDTTPELDAKRANYYQGQIGILRWMCELGRIDILVDVAMLSRFLAAPRRGHLDQVFHIYAYLKSHDKTSMVFDDTMPYFDETRFTKCDWAEYYPGAAEAIPPNAPEIRGKSVTMTCYVDADHAGCQATRRSQTGVLIFINRAPILWFSKRQNTVETSTFGSEFVAARIAVEMVEGLRYKLRMLGVQVDGPTNMLCDNAAVVLNASKPESTLKKKHNAIAYHRVREAQAAGVIRIAKEEGETNLADILTKSLPGPRLRALLQCILW